MHGVNPTIVPGEDLCVIDNVNEPENKAFTKVLRNIADNELDNVLRTLDPSGTWKIHLA